MTKGLILAAPGSSHGKTTVMLGLLRAYRARDAALAPAPAKCGPDFIDPLHHAVASGRLSLTLDPFAMDDAALARQWARVDAPWTLAEGTMGLFDGPAGIDASTADLAERLGWPVVLVMDVKGQARTVAASALGFRHYRPAVAPVGVILNRVGSPKHEALARAALAEIGLPVLGALPRDAGLTMPERHLGLAFPEEIAGFGAFLDHAGALVAQHVDLDALAALARPSRLAVAATAPSSPPPPPAQVIAVADDRAFRFAYPHQLAGWRSAGAEIVPFSPLADQGPDPRAGFVYLPGGYPELHAEALAAAQRWRAGMIAARDRGAWIYGECGGFMALGDALEDYDGALRPMAGLLPLTTSFKRRKLHLGYRRCRLLTDTPLGAAGAIWRGHEFHYATIVAQDAADPLYAVADAADAPLGPMGLRRDRVIGGFPHLIAQPTPAILQTAGAA